MGGRQKEGSAAAARSPAGCPARSRAAGSPSADGSAGSPPKPYTASGKWRGKRKGVQQEAAPFRGDGFSGSHLGPHEGEAVRFFWEHGGPEQQGPRMAVLEKPGPASGVPPHRRSEHLGSRQGTCRPVNGRKPSQEHPEASVSRVHRR